MYTRFAETLRKLRTERGLSQAQLGKQLFVYRSTVTRWESGIRLPDATMIPQLARCLGVDANSLFDLAAEGDESPNIIIVDDNDVVLADGVSVLKEVMPNATVTGFIWPQKAIEYARANRISLAFLDIELGSSSGLVLCDKLLEIDSGTCVVFLTAYPDYALDAWKTKARGFMLKPLTPEDVKGQLKKLRYPFLMGGADE